MISPSESLVLFAVASLSLSLLSSKVEGVIAGVAVYLNPNSISTSSDTADSYDLYLTNFSNLGALPCLT